MKIDYTAADAADLERTFLRLNRSNTREGRAIRCAFVIGLRACGIQCAHIERGKVHALRVFRPDGHDFTPEQVEEWREWKKQNGLRKSHITAYILI